MRRHAVGRRSGADAVAEALVRDEEEGLVAAVVQLGEDDRPAGCHAEIVLLVDGLGRAEKAPGVQFLVAQELVDVAVEIVGARFGDEADGAAGSVAHVGFEAAGRHAEFGDGVHRRRIDLGPGDAVAVELAGGRDRGAVEGHAVGAAAAPADTELARGVHFRGLVGRDRRGCARRR